MSGGGWKGEAFRCGGRKTEFISEVVEETRLAKDCEREEAVDWNCACMLFAPPPLVSDLDLASDLGLESVLSRRRMPDTAYETGYVKYDEERFGVFRCVGGVCREGDARDGGEDGVAALVGIFGEEYCAPYGAGN